MNILNKNEQSNLITDLLNQCGYNTYQESSNNTIYYPEDKTIMTDSKMPYVLLASGEVKHIDKWDGEIIDYD